jgi:iron complex transport system substrate-binding protein
LATAILELLIALGIQPIAFADHLQLHRGDYDNPIQQIPYLGRLITTQPVNLGMQYTPSIEALVQSKPDLILGSNFLKNQYAILSQIAPTLLLRWWGGDTETNLRAIATAVNQPEQAEKVLTTMQQKITDAREQFALLVKAHPNILMLSSRNMQDLNLFSAQDNRCGSVVEALGFHLVTPPQVESQHLPSTPITVEALPDLNQADLAILFGANFTASRQFANQAQLNQEQFDQAQFESHQLSNFKNAWEKNAIAQALKVSQQGRVYFMPTYICLGLPGPIGTELYLNELKKQLLSSN